jgi:hypothetical protein
MGADDGVCRDWVFCGSELERRFEKGNVAAARFKGGANSRVHLEAVYVKWFTTT